MRQSAYAEGPLLTLMGETANFPLSLRNCGQKHGDAFRWWRTYTGDTIFVRHAGVMLGIPEIKPSKAKLYSSGDGYG